MGFIGLAIALPPPSVHEVSLSKSRWLNSKSSKFIRWGCYSNQNCEEVILSKTESVWLWDQNYLIKSKQISLAWRSAITWHIQHYTGAVGDWHVCHKTLLWLQNCPLRTKVSVVILVKFCHNENSVTIEILLRVCDLLDYTADDLTGKSMYSLVHAADVHKIKQTHVDCKLHLCLAMMIQNDRF